MAPLFSKFKKIGIIILNISIILFSSYFIWQSERFQQKVSPHKYWGNKVKTLEKELKKDVVKIKFLRLDLEKEKTLCQYHEKQARIKAEEKNENINDIYFEIENDHIKKINEIKHEIDNLVKEEEKVKDNLKIAYNKVKILN